MTPSKAMHNNTVPVNPAHFESKHGIRFLQPDMAAPAANPRLLHALTVTSRDTQGLPASRRRLTTAQIPIQARSGTGHSNPSGYTSQLFLL